MDRLPFDYMNAAGWAKTVEQVRAMAAIPYTTHVVVGGYTPPAREGNKGGTTFIRLHDGTFGNSLGLNNDGIAYLKQHGREMVSIIHDADKLAVLNSNWFAPQEAGILAETAAEVGFDINEDNEGCPNVFDGGKQKVIPSYDPELAERADEAIARAVGSSIEIWKKVSPYVNPNDRIRVADRMVKYKYDRLTAINTVPNWRPRGKDGKLLITAKNTGGYCGMSGTGAKWLAILNVDHFVELLKPHDIRVNGTNGIASGADLEDFRLTGCDSMQVGGVIYNADSPKPLADIAREWMSEFGERFS